MHCVILELDIGMDLDVHVEDDMWKPYWSATTDAGNTLKRLCILVYVSSLKLETNQNL